MKSAGEDTSADESCFKNSIVWPKAKCKFNMENCLLAWENSDFDITNFNIQAKNKASIKLVLSNYLCLTMADKVCMDVWRELIKGQ